MHARVIWDSSVTPPSLLLQQRVLGSWQQSASFTMRSFPPTQISKCYTVRFQIEGAVQNFMWDLKSMHDSLTINTWIPDRSTPLFIFLLKFEPGSNFDLHHESVCQYLVLRKKKNIFPYSDEDIHMKEVVFGVWLGVWINASSQRGISAL